MADDGKDADLRIGDPQPDAVTETGQAGSRSTSHPNGTEGTRPRVGSGGLSEHTRNRLALQLRSMYDTVVQQPVPDRFADLIARLGDADRDKA